MTNECLVFGQSFKKFISTRFKMTAGGGRRAAAQVRVVQVERVPDERQRGDPEHERAARGITFSAVNPSEGR